MQFTRASAPISKLPSAAAAKHTLDPARLACASICSAGTCLSCGVDRAKSLGDGDLAEMRRNYGAAPIARVRHSFATA